MGPRDQGDWRTQAPKHPGPLGRASPNRAVATAVWPYPGRAPGVVGDPDRPHWHGGGRGRVHGSRGERSGAGHRFRRLGRPGGVHGDAGVPHRGGTLVSRLKPSVICALAGLLYCRQFDPGRPAVRDGRRLIQVPKGPTTATQFKSFRRRHLPASAAGRRAVPPPRANRAPEGGMNRATGTPRRPCRSGSRSATATPAARLTLHLPGAAAQSPMPVGKVPIQDATGLRILSPETSRDGWMSLQGVQTSHPKPEVRKQLQVW